MKIIIAPDSFKESLGATEIAKAIAKGFRSVFPKATIVLAPMADGGEGTIECIAHHQNAKIRELFITDPLGNKIPSSYAICNNTAIIEIAKASGLALISPSLRNPLKTSSIGTGELIVDALTQGCRRFIIGIGGSVTCDAGMGALSALGVIFYDKAGKQLEPCGGNLRKIVDIHTEHLDPRTLASEWILAHDVNNPLLGPTGALLYAPQKGATSLDLPILHEGFERFVQCVQNNTQHKTIGTLPGGGAAGGLAAGLFAFLKAKLIPGAEVLIDAIQLSDTMKGADLVITGEGQMDEQTIYGKTPIAVAQLAKSHGIPVIGIVGKLGDGYEAVYEKGINAVFSIADGPRTYEFCQTHVKTLLTDTSINIAKLMSSFSTF